MMNRSDLTIEALNQSHDRSGFLCGEIALDQYLQKQARQDIKRRISQVFVATQPEQQTVIMGYYTLSALSIELSQLPEALARKLPRHSIPAALIGRLAVKQSYHGSGIGSMLLADAIKRTLALTDQIAIYAMVVDAINPAAQDFYKQYGFQILSQQSQRLFLPLKSL